MTEPCRLRAMTEDDLVPVLSWRNHPDVRRYMLTQHVISLDEHRLWFHRMALEPGRCLLIAESGDVPLGYVGFAGAGAGGIADWGFYAAPDAPRGSGRQLGRAALAFAFVQLQCHKVCGQALDFNAASIAFHERLGFRREGVLREQQCLAGQYHDLVCFGLLHDEWKQQNDQGGS